MITSYTASTLPKGPFNAYREFPVPARTEVGSQLSLQPQRLHSNSPLASWAGEAFMSVCNVVGLTLCEVSATDRLIQQIEGASSVGVDIDLRRYLLREPLLTRAVRDVAATTRVLFGETTINARLGYDNSRGQEVHLVVESDDIDRDLDRLDRLDREWLSAQDAGMKQRVLVLLG